MNAEWQSLKEQVRKAGLNVEVLNYEIPMYNLHTNLVKTEEAQIKQLVDGKGAFLGGQQWYILGLKAMGCTAILEAQALQLQSEEQEKTKTKTKEKRENKELETY